MDSHKKTNNNYDRVMSRVYNRSRSSLRSGSNVARHEVSTSGRVGAKPSVSAVSSSVFSELPTVLNDYVPDIDSNKVGKRRLVKPRRTLMSLDPGKAKSPQRASRDRAIEYGRNIRARGSAPVLYNSGEEWSESHFRQCYSSRSHTRLKELKDEIKAFQETDKLLKLRSHLYTRCGVVLDDTGQVLKDQGVQASPEPDKENTTLRRSKWLQLIGREDLKDSTSSRYVVCAEHFNAEDICMRNIRKILKNNCLPSLLLPATTKEDKQNQIDTKMVDTAIQTESSSKSLVISNTVTSSIETDKEGKSHDITQTLVSLSSDTPRKRELKLESSDCKKRLKVKETEQATSKLQLGTFHKLSDRFLSKNLADLVKAQMDLKSSFKGNRYTLAYKMFCIKLYYVSPQAYRLLEKTFCLPRRAALSKLYIPMSTKVNDELMATLKLKVDNMSDREKQCSIVVDAMSLKTYLFYDIKHDKIIGFHEVDGVQSSTPAKNALVAMVRGIFVEWSQPIGFALLSECKSDINISTISKWIDKLITKLFEIGLNIRTFVSGIGSDLLNAAKKRGISVQKTFFTVNDRKIYYIFDAPHLIKSVRNNFIACNFHFQNGSVAKFEHIKQFYEYDKKKTFKQAYKLTNSHINPTNCEKMKVRLAVQLLSRCVASGLSSYVDFGIIDETASNTATFIRYMNDLFDSLNSSTLSHSYSHKRAFCGDERQVNFFKDMLRFFETIKLINPKKGNDVTKPVKFIQGFRITIQSILNLFEDFKLEGYEYVLTRRLNQDVIENFFSKIRSQNGMATEPTSRQFMSAFRKIYIANITQAPKESNCAADITGFLDHLKDFQNYHNDVGDAVSLPDVSNANVNEDNLSEIVRSDYVDFDMPDKNALFYVCGALLKKCSNHHNCETFRSYINQQTFNLSEECRYIVHYRNYRPDQNLLVIPPDSFVKNIEKMEQIFRVTFVQEHINTKIGASIYKEMNNVEFTLPCPCFPKHYLFKLYIRMRIYFTLVNNNKAFRTSRNRRNFFSVSFY